MKFLLGSALAVALMMPVASYAEDATASVAGKVIQRVSRAAANNQTAVACNLCFTCGGDWPVFAGSIRSSGDRPIERGSSCSSTLTTRADGSPFLCCR